MRSAPAPLVNGTAAPGFEAVREVFESHFAAQREVGAAFAAHVDGKPVVDLWGGLADRPAAKPWAADTLANVFSGSKGLVATCLALLIDRGLLDLDLPVRRYWPDFGDHGKDRILVRHVVSHRAGLPGISTPVTVAESTDSEAMARLVAEQRPLTPPGDAVEYHALTFGWICGELVRRIDGRSLGDFLREEVALPLGLDIWIGLPASEEHRVAFVEQAPAFAREYEEMLKACGGDEVAWATWANPPRFGEELAANLPEWHAAEVPGSNAIVSARSLSRLYACLARGGELDGFRLLAPDTVALVRRRIAVGPVPAAGVQLAFGVGFGLQTPEPQYGLPPDAFGHTGAGGSVHAAWPELRTSLSYTPNLLASAGTVDPRASSLLEALHRAVTC